MCSEIIRVVSVRIYVIYVKTASGIRNFKCVFVWVETKSEAIVYNWTNWAKNYNMHNSKNLMKLLYQVLQEPKHRNY